MSYTGSCDTVIDSPRSGRFVAKWATIDRPYCFLLLTEANQSSGRTARCFTMAGLLNQARRHPDYKRHYSGQNPLSNGSNYLFADGHSAWHSAEFTATKLICCMDFGTGGNNRAGARSIREQNCGGSTGDGDTRRR